MEKLKFTERSWHAILCKSTWGDCLPENICGYFWSMIIAIIIFPLAIIGHILNIMTKGEVRAAWWALYPIACIAIGALIIESPSEQMKSVWNPLRHSIWWMLAVGVGFSLLVITVIAIIFLCLWLQEEVYKPWKQKKWTAEQGKKQKTPNPLIEGWKSFKGKYCAPITWK